ncbi:MAG: hypothetical protein OEZ13_08160 [Spirochaetia bacterium]|nr:hypothetical protein [Spirochaetia bacterium]
MNLNFSILFENLLFFVVIAFFVEIAITTLFSIGYIENLMSSFGSNIKSLVILIVSFALCMKIPQLQILKGLMKPPLQSTIHLVISALLLARMVEFFAKKRS